MSSWAERVHRRAADFGSVVTSCGGHPGSSTPAYPYRLEKVKFGVPLEEVCKINDNIPGPLLVLILKLNKESPNKRDVFRAPGHQGAMKKLIHFLQTGRLVNVDNYSVYTIASVLKKFLRKIPNGIFGRSGEKELFTINELKNEAEQTDRLQRLFASLPKYTQHLLVLLFGTFRVIASNAAHAGTGMSSEALGVSVAPSFFQSCASDGKTARMEDVLKYKVATKIMQNIIDKFATHDLFGRDNYEYYARVTGRILKVQDEWICSFQYPPPPRGKLAQQKYALQHSLEAEKTWLQCQCERWGLLAQEESRSTPALLTSSSSALENSVLSLGVSPEHSFIESCARLSVSLEGPGLFAMTSSPLHSDVDDDVDDDDDVEDDDDFSAELEEVSRDQYHQAYNLDSSDIQELDFDEKVIMRRYRQNNKKKTAPKSMQMRNQRQRRLRAGTKSLDSGEHLTTSSNAATNLISTTAAGAGATTITTAAAMCSMSNELSGSAGALSSANCRAARSPPMSIGGSGGAAATTTKKASKKSATRSCSRCNRGIRHASSCSSASGGSNNANGSSMTMDELRAVNRYAESTKSLSFLPQVHERQAERMRTRSEWFLGPQDEVVALKLADSCVAGSYEALESNHELIYQFFKMQHQHRQQQQQQQQQQQHEQQQLNKSQPECMDIDESMTTTSSSCRSTAQFQHSTKAFLNSSNQLPLAAQCRPRPAVEHGQRRLLLDANTVGTIRLSNSAESVRRPSTRRLLINVPRQYPLRASLRRSKEKQMANNVSNANTHVGTHGGNGSGGSMSGYVPANTTQQTNSLTATTTLIPGLNQRNSSPYKPPRI